jgi:hypothetical protein
MCGALAVVAKEMSEEYANAAGASLAISTSSTPNVS